MNNLKPRIAIYCKLSRDNTNYKLLEQQWRNFLRKIETAKDIKQMKNDVSKILKNQRKHFFKEIERKANSREKMIQQIKQETKKTIKQYILMKKDKKRTI